MVGVGCWVLRGKGGRKVSYVKSFDIVFELVSFFELGHVSLRFTLFIGSVDELRRSP